MNQMEPQTFIPFNTHMYVKKIMKTGLNESQAEAIINAIINGKQVDTSTLATKEDIHDLDAKIVKIIHNLESKIAKLTLDTKEQFHNLRVEVVKINAKVEGMEANLRVEIHKNNTSNLKWFIGTSITLAAIIISTNYLL